MADPAPVQPTPESTPQPVLSVEWWKATVLGGITAGSAVSIAMDWWNPTKEQLVAIGGLGTWLVLTVFPLIAYFVHNRVTPTVKVARLVAAAKVEGETQLANDLNTLAAAPFRRSIPDLPVSAPEPPTSVGGYVRGVTGSMDRTLVAVRWDDGTITEDIWSGDIPEIGARVKR